MAALLRMVPSPLARGESPNPVITAYMTHCRAAGLRPSTIRLRTQWLTRLARDVDLEAATHDDLLGWIARHDWLPETRRSARNTIRAFYAWASEDGRIDPNPATRLPPVRVPAGVPRPAPTDVLQRALAAATDRDRLIIGLAAYAGLRRSEIATLKWNSISWAGLHVVGKGGRSRHIPLLPQLRTILEAEQELRGRGLVGTGWRFHHVDTCSSYVFPGRGELGRHISPYTVGRILSDGLGEGWSGHTLRHRFATCAYAVDRDILTVQQLLGHSSPATTARYTAVPQGAAMAAVMGAAA